MIEFKVYVFNFRCYNNKRFKVNFFMFYFINEMNIFYS